MQRLVALKLQRLQKQKVLFSLIKGDEEDRRLLQEN
jgi:hypothetical protein